MSIDLVQLIESNPITKLNGNYQSKIIEKVKTNFNNYEQQMFVSSFYCYLNYDYQNDFVIDLDNVWEWVGFSNKGHSKYILEKNFIINKDYKILLTKLRKQTNIAPEPSGAKKENTRGGHNKEKIMLNIETFKKYCLKAGTKKADEIHDYFIKLEKVLQEIIMEESNELKLQLEQQQENQKTEIQKIEENQKQALQKQKVLEREKILLSEYGTIGSIFYVIKVKTFENKNYIIKIGESRRGIAQRYKEHKSKYEECLLLDCFVVNKSKDFETFIKDHELVRGNRVREWKGHEMTADALDRTVIAGPVEATAAGNILVQAVATGELSGIAAMRSVMRRSFTLKSFKPRTSKKSIESWREALDRFQDLPVVAAASSTSIRRLRKAKI